MLDFVGDGRPAFSFTNATVNRVWLTKRYDGETELYLSNSMVTFYFPAAGSNETVFYGYAGTQNADFVSTRVLYQMRYAVAQEVEGTHIFIVPEGYKLSCNSTTYVCNANYNSDINIITFKSSNKI